MTELIFAHQISNYGSIYITHPSEDLPRFTADDSDLLFSQGFVWYSDCVAFKGRGQLFSYWIRVHVADRLNLRKDISRAILLPFTVPQEGQLFLDGGLNLPVPFRMSPGKYNLLFETRYCTDDEIRSSSEYDFLVEELDAQEPEVGLGDEDRPEMCFFTFVPTTEPVEPEIIYPSYEELLDLRKNGTEHNSFDPRPALALHHSQTVGRSN